MRQILNKSCCKSLVQQACDAQHDNFCNGLESLRGRSLYISISFLKLTGKTV